MLARVLAIVVRNYKLYLFTYLFINIKILNCEKKLFSSNVTSEYLKVTLMDATIIATSFLVNKGEYNSDVMTHAAG